MTLPDAARVFVRILALVGLILTGLITLLALRMLERVVHRVTRPWTPHITRFVCRTGLRIIGLRLTVEGTPMTARGAMVANHSSWLDIFVLNAPTCITFVSKAEVAGWPGIGWLARATGTLFIERDRHKARDHTALIQSRLLAGDRLLFFPEGTSTDGQRVLPFKTTLFAAFFAPELRGDIAVQPVSVIYRAPEGADARFYGWWGDMALAPHLVSILAPRRGGSVRVVYHAPRPVSAFEDRKALARDAHDAVRAGFERHHALAGTSLKDLGDAAE
ncbi:MAG: lysophospholipid acyltransferase family protein [Pseudomonadota bacterium]